MDRATTDAAFSSSPYIEANLFSTPKQLILCRKSGKQIWSYLHPKNAQPISCAWSPDGKFLAIVYNTKTCQLLYVATGKPADSPNESDVSCLTWPTVAASKRTSRSHRQELVDALPHFKTAGARINSDVPELIIGECSGTLKIVMFGTLTIGPISLGAGAKDVVNGVFIDSVNGQYVALVGQNQLVVLDVDLRNHNLQELSLAKAHVDTVMHRLCALVRKYNSVSNEISSYWKQFAIPSSDLLCETVLSGFALNPEVADWMKSQHEAGFKRWYKAVGSALETLRSLLVDKIMPTVNEVLITLGELCGHNVNFEGNASKMDDSARLATEMLRQITTERDNLEKASDTFENLAAWLEIAFNEEIDRLGGVTKNQDVDITKVLRTLDSPHHYRGLGDGATELQSQFDGATQYICDLLLNQFTIAQTIELPQYSEKVVEVIAKNRIYTIGYKDGRSYVHDGN